MSRELVANFGLHTWSAFVTRANSRLTSKAAAGGGDASQREERGSDSWAGTPDYKTAARMAASGWQDGAAAVGRSLDNVTPEQDVLPAWDLEVAGAIPCMPAVMAGEMECMWQQRDDLRAVRRVALFVPTVYHCGVPSEEVASYGKAVAATCRAIEAAGMDCAIYSLDVTDSYNGPVGYGVSVRAYGEPMDLAKIAFAFHPSFLRRICFAWREMTPEACKAGISNGGYGMCITKPDATHARAVCGDVGAACVVLPTVSELHGQGKLRGGDSAVRELIPFLRQQADDAVKAASGGVVS